MPAPLSSNADMADREGKALDWRQRLEPLRVTLSNQSFLGGEVPVHNDAVVEAFAGRAELDASPFVEIARLKRGETAADPRGLFCRYYEELTRAVHRVNRFTTGA